MDHRHDDEDELLRSVALRNASSILLARQRAEEALELRTRELAHSVAMMRATLEATTDGILATDDHGRITGHNENFLRMWGLPADAVAAGDHLQLVEVTRRLFDDPERFIARVREIYAGSATDVSDVLELADGRVFERFSRLQLVDGRNVGRVWSFRDITERRRAEEALRDETRVLDLLHRSGAAIAATLDLPALLQTIVDAATEISGARFGTFSCDTTDENGDPLTLRALTEAPPAGLLMRSVLTIPVLSRTGERIGGLWLGHPEVAVFTTRTERLVAGIAAQAAMAIDNARLYEEAKRQARDRERLVEAERAARSGIERISRMKDEFLATLSHELRTPLTAILGWARVLQLKKGDAATVDRGIDAVARNARSQAQLIEDLLDMSRIVSGKVRLDVQPTDLGGVIDAAVDSVRPSADAKEIRLRKIVDPLAGPVSGDPGRLQQVVWNLLTNAVKFTPKGGAVDVLLERVKSHLQLTVHDSGIGIGPDFLPQVFDRFRQADSSTTRHHGGLGLGLSIVKQLVELHGGSVRAESKGAGRGATFIVSLPLAPVRAEAGREHPATERAGSNAWDVVDLDGVKVLVVDDEPDSRELLMQVLAQSRAEVLVAPSAADALRLLASRRPDVLVSDIGMPGKDGYQFIREVRRLPAAEGGRTPAIALTAFARSEDRTRAMMAGYQVHMAKPIEPPELIATVGSLAGRMAERD